jgi:hypothetical protein
MSLAGLGLGLLCATTGASATGPVLGQPQPAALPRYPLGALPLPDFLAPGDPLTLSDLRYATPGETRDEHSLLAGVRWRSVGYASLELVGERSRFAFFSHRLSLAVSEEGDDWTLGASLRTRRVIVWADGRSRTGRSGRSWAFGPTVQLRLTSDVEVYGWIQGDSERPHGRSLTELGMGALWQRGAWLETSLRYARSYVTTAAGDQNRVDAAQASVVAQLARAELAAFGLLDDVAGRFPRREAEAGLGFRLPLLPRLLLEADASGRFDSEAGALRHGIGGAITWFGRRFTLPRAGLVAERSVELARRATAAGEYELRAFSEGELRQQRQRLSLSRRAPELRTEMEAVYSAQVEERALPLIGVRLRRHDNVFTGERVGSGALLLGMPWPPAWPWAKGEGAVPFLTLELEHARATTASHFRSETDRVLLTISLSREMDVVLRYVRAEPTALDVIRGIGTRRSLAVEYVYARGR